MQGGEITGAIPMIGYFLTQAALALIDGAIIALLFAVGVAVGMSDDHDGTAGLAGISHPALCLQHQGYTCDENKEHHSNGCYLLIIRSLLSSVGTVSPGILSRVHPAGLS